MAHLAGIQLAEHDCRQGCLVADVSVVKKTQAEGHLWGAGVWGGGAEGSSATIISSGPSDGTSPHDMT